MTRRRRQTVFIRIYEETRDALLRTQASVRAEQVRLGLPRKTSTFADLIEGALHVQTKWKSLFLISTYAVARSKYQALTLEP